MRLPFSHPRVGLNLQPEHIHLVQLSQYRGGLRLEAFASCYTQDLARLVYERKLKGLPTAIHLPWQQVKVRQLAFPPGLPSTLVATEIAAQMQGVGYDYVVNAAGKALVFSADHTYIQAQVAKIQAAGLCVKVVDIDAFSLHRTLNTVLDTKKLWDELDTAIAGFLQSLPWQVKDVAPTSISIQPHLNKTAFLQQAHDYRLAIGLACSEKW